MNNKMAIHNLKEVFNILETRVFTLRDKIPELSAKQIQDELTRILKIIIGGDDK